ncbi:MAG: efflux RND transporter periplasmic adaptor subunit, partial [Gammaproteobacteria bacterium]
MITKAFRLTSLAAAFTAAAMLSPVSAQDETAAPVATVPADLIYTVSDGSTARGAVLGGTIVPEKMVKLLAQMPGEVKFISGEEGDAFRNGDNLVGLDTATLEAKQRAARMGLNNAMTQYNREVLTPNSQSNGMLGGAPSMFSMFSDPMRSMMGQGSPGYERHSNLVGQQTQVEAAQASVREVEEMLKNAVSVAPFDGVIVQKMVEVGDVVQPGMPLVVYADTSVLQIQVEVPSRLVATLSEGDRISARMDHKPDPVTVTV